MKKLPDNTLWYFLQNGDINAFSELFKRYYEMLYGYGIKLSGNASLTEDTLQDVFSYIFLKRSTLGSVENPKSYLFVSFKRALLKGLKKERVFTDYEKIVETIGSFEFSPEEISIEQELTVQKNAVIAKLLNRLSAREREAIFLKYYSDLKLVEVASVMDISYQSVLNTLQKAFRKLRKELESEAIMGVLHY